jgi:hypothetical protein
MSTKQKVDENVDNILKPISYELDPIKKLSDSAKVTYFALERYKDEMITLRYLINKAFKIKNVWNIYHLWEYIKTLTATPNPAYFDIRNYMITIKSNPELNIIDTYVINAEREIEGFVRKNIHQNEVKLMKFTGIKENILLTAVISKMNKFSSTKKITALDVYDVYEKYNIDMHIKLLEDALMIYNHDIIDEKIDINKNISSGIKHNADKIIKFYTDFFNMKNAKEIGIQNVSEHNKQIIGYVYNNTLKYVTKKGWKTYPINESVEENPIIVGMYSEGMQFKMRDPIKKAKVGENTNNVDMRKMQRGANCLTRGKIYLTKINRKLNISNNEFTIFGICESIKRELIKRESEHKDNYKWFYYN